MKNNYFVTLTTIDENNESRDYCFTFSLSTKETEESTRAKIFSYLEKTEVIGKMVEISIIQLSPSPIEL